MNPPDSIGTSSGSTHNPTGNPFVVSIDSISKRNRSRIVLAIDLDYSEDESSLEERAVEIIRSTSRYICAVKFNFHLLIPLSLSQLRAITNVISSYGLVSIADVKLNDIDNTNRIAVEYLHKAGISAVIVNPFAGYEGGLDLAFQRARVLGMGVITLAYMSHKGADEGYGLRLDSGETIYELFLKRARSWGADGIIMGSTRPEKISLARSRVGPSVRIFSPGSGAQGGDASASLEAGADYVIFGRGIVSEKDPESAAMRIREQLLAWTERH